MSDKKNPNPPTELNIELTEEMAEGMYTNFAMIGHSPAEFVFDFVRLLPNLNKAKVKSRVIMTPQNAKRLMMALRENIKLYENQFGLIKEDNNPPIPPVQFSTPKGLA
jgi:Protein of unknown function (DUF3467)